MHTLSTSRIMPLLVFGVSLFMFSGCTNEPEAEDTIHHYNPMWSADGAWLAAGYEHIPAGRSQDGDAIRALNLVTLKVDGAASPEAYSVPGMSPRDRFSFVPDLEAVIAAATGNGLVFADMQGRSMGTLSTPGLPVRPSCFSFDESGASYVWAGNEDGRVRVGRATYQSEPWSPLSVTTLIDSLTGAGISDVLAVDAASFAARFSDGTVVQYAYDGRELARFQLLPKNDADSWLNRLHLYRSGNRNYLYAVDDSGIVSLDLSAKKATLLVKGNVRGFTVSSASHRMFFATSTGDIWCALFDGSPLFRVPQHSMPNWSPNGTWYAAVGAVSRNRDTLSVKKLGG